MSLATEPNTGGVCAAMEARFADADARRMAELDRLIDHGFGSTNPRDIPPDELDSPATAAPPPSQEPAMPKPDRKLCTNCGKNPLRADNESGLCRDCRVAPKKNRTAPTAPRAVPSPRPPLRPAHVGLDTLTVPDLLDLRRAIDAEVKVRLEKLDAERKQLLEAMAKDEQLLREAV